MADAAGPLPPGVPVGIVGAGAMGAGIAQVAACAGHPVLIHDARAGAAAAAVAGIESALDRLAARGRMAAAARDSALARLSPVASVQDLAPAGLVIEAVTEDLDTKRALFSTLESVVEAGAILASNTSALSITALGAGCRHPARVAGMHFFNPAPVMALVEIVSGLATDPAVAARLAATAAAWGKEPVHATATPGFIVNRVARPYYAEALRLLEEGVSDPATLDAILREGGGFPMGPFALMDLIGLDVNLAVTRAVFDAFHGDPRFRPSLRQHEMVAAGWLGRKSGRGFFRHDAGAAPPVPCTAPPAPPPERVALAPGHPLDAALRAAGLRVVTADLPPGWMQLSGATLAPSDGRSATLAAAQDGPQDLVLHDLARGQGSGHRIALAAADQAPAGAARAAAGLFQALGTAVSVIDDTPGLVVLRTVAMLANEACEALLHGVATPADLDRAMLRGLNHPHGPLAWADALGPGRVLAVLDAIHAATGDPRYRASALLRRRVAAARPLHPGAPLQT